MENRKFGKTDLTPSILGFGMMRLQKREDGSIDEEWAIRTLRSAIDNGLTYVEQVVTNVSEVQMAVDVLLEQVDAIFVPNDSVIQTAMAVVADSAAEMGVPVYGSSAVMVQSGAFATISIGDRDIGAITADMLHTYLTGTPIEEIPAIVVDEFTMVINQTTADMIGAELPADVLETAVIVN